jgi:hypothetical protein
MVSVESYMKNFYLKSITSLALIVYPHSTACDTAGGFPLVMPPLRIVSTTHKATGTTALVTPLRRSHPDYLKLYLKWFHHQHQPIYVPPAGAQAFLMDYT